MVQPCLRLPHYVGQGFADVRLKSKSRLTSARVLSPDFVEEPLALPESSRTNADDHLPRASLGRVEGVDGFVESRDVADVRPQSSVPHPLDDISQLGTVGLDNEVDRQAD